MRRPRHRVCLRSRWSANPDDGDTGVRFYRPKPYLLVTPADPTGRLVNMKLEYLPDFNEEYSAHVKGKASVALKDGWNLVGVNTKEAPKEKEEPPAKIEDIPLPAGGGRRDQRADRLLRVGLRDTPAARSSSRAGGTSA